jgi:protein gp37
MDDVRARLFKLIDATPNLDWLILTKRPENILKMWPTEDDGAGGRLAKAIMGTGMKGKLVRRRDNVWLGCSVENQEYANQRIPELLKCRDLSPVLFLSCEPLLGPVDLMSIQVPSPIGGIGEDAHDDDLIDCINGDVFSGEFARITGHGPTIDFVITGGESGPNARPSHPNWFRSLRDQCDAANVPFHFKQWGEWSPYDRGGVDAAELAEAGSLDLPMVRYGKKLAGRLLDGVTHDGFPKH